MTRSQSEVIVSTIIADLAPLITKGDLESVKEQMAAKADIEAIDTRFESVITGIESAKHWLSSGLLIIALSILALAFWFCSR